MTTSLASSLDILSLTSSTRWASDSLSDNDDEDEIVWSLSSSALLSTSPPLHSPLSETADFVLVPRATAAAPSSASPTADTIAEEMAALSLTPATHARENADPPAVPSPTAPQRTSVQGSTPTRKARRAVRRQATTTTTTTEQHQQHQSRQQRTPTTTAPPAAPRRKSKKGTNKRARGSSPGSASSASSTGVAASSPEARPSRVRSAGKGAAKKGGAGLSTTTTTTTTGLGARAVVDDSVSETSEASTPSSSSPASTPYQEAHKYMTSCVESTFLSPIIPAGIIH